MERGDIWFADLEPIRGRKQAKARYVMIVSQRSFNQLGVQLIAPITSGGEFARARGFTVSLSGAGTRATGVILCHQVRAIDLKARDGRFIEKAPDFVVAEVLGRLSALFE
ncbi:type II toxin-antitoxin system PemK/MazF family toxin [Rhizobium terrae]|uniref:type II toxin-antitoxin system PemK/MazF family toxin n=1 Tax=Rhizobium terrae TaxID=2171756 RepID=UPI000E3D444C|nr:type II toxin-antitoxin system PemK/MazF family toxin [Rhizobium terrae]